MNTIPRIIKLYFQTTSALFPNLAGNQAFHLFQRTRPFKQRFRKREKAFYKKVKPYEISGYPENSKVYELGDPNGELVLLIHGWDSNAGSMGRIAENLAEEGKRIVAIDLPGHGHSSLKKANLYLCRDAVRNLIFHLKPQKPFSIVSHSFGSTVAAYALWMSSYEVKNWVMLTSPDTSEEIFRDYQKLIGLGQKSYRVMEGKANRVIKERVSNVSTATWVKGSRVQNLNIIHDKFDKVIPYANALSIQTENPWIKLQTIQKVGHYKMLNNPDVLSMVKKGINEGINVRNFQSEKPLKRTIAV